MANPDHEELVLEELRRASDSGEGVARSELQEACALGAGDLSAVLESLVERDVIREDPPDSFELIDSEDEERVAAEADAALEAAQQEREKTPTAARVRGHRSELDEPRERRPERGGREHETVLTVPMIDKLEPTALGELVKAGVEGAEGGEFVLRVRQ